MDAEIRSLLRVYQSSRDDSVAVQIGSRLLRLSSLEEYIDKYEQQDPDITADIIRILFITAFPEASEVIKLYLNLGHLGNRWQFTSADEYLVDYVYLNVYCENTPVASLRIGHAFELMDAIPFVRDYFGKVQLLMPPGQVKVQRFGREAHLFIPTFSNRTCHKNYEIIVEIKPCFELGTEGGYPIEKWAHGQRHGYTRPIENEDWRDSSWDDMPRPPTLNVFDYDMLPEFAKPDLKSPSGHTLMPEYVVASEVQRVQVRDIDGPAWVDDYSSIAKIYVGYLLNGLQIRDEENYRHYWSWRPATIRYECRPGSEAVNNLDLDETIQGGPVLPAIQGQTGCGHLLDTQELRQVRRCPNCGAYWEPEVLEAYQLENTSNQPEFDVPPHVNQALAFLMSFYFHLNRGDIGSVLGGTELNVSFGSTNYGPETPDNLRPGGFVG